MTIPTATIAAYAPHGNAQLAFALPAGTVTTDPETGNAVQLTETVEYLAVLTPSQPNWRGQSGADDTSYPVTGRLLHPSILDPRITNGSQAEAVINGYRGRLELTFDLRMEQAAYRDLRQPLNGVFRVIGGP